MAAVALIMGNMIGSGVFLLPASLAPFGWNSVIAWALTIAGALVLAAVLARLTREVPQSGGATSFVGTAFGKLAEFLIAWGYLISIPLGSAVLAISAVSYASRLAPVFGAGAAAPMISALVLIAIITLVNFRGVRAAGGVQIVTLLIKLVPLVLVVILAARALTTGEAQIAPFEPAAISGSKVAGAAALTLFAVLGFECASIAAARVENPTVNVPRATMIGTALAGLLYLLVSSAITLLLPPATVAASPAPFATFVATFWDAGPAQFVALFAVVSCIGALNGWLMVGGEMTRDMAARGELPAWLAATDARGTPRRAILATALATALFLLLNASRSMQGIFDYLLLLSTSTALWFYLGFAFAAIKLGVARMLAAIGAIYSLWTLWGAGIEASGLSVVLMVLGLPLWWWARRTRARGTQGIEGGLASL
ncbi:MAG: amino acid permease [Croceibacterium sp.]